MRFHADAINVDKQKVAMYGYSAGAGTSLWLAFHGDLAQAGHSDPILRESTRLVAAGGIEGQASYDLDTWETNVFSSFGLDLVDTANDLDLFQRMLAFNGASSLAEMYSPAGEAYRANVDMLGLMSLDDPEFFFINSIEPSGFPSNETELVHHGLHAQALQDRADSIGHPSVIYGPQVGLSDPSGEQIGPWLIRKLRQ